MSLKLSNIIGVIEKFAPTNLKEDYDNVGLMIGDRDSLINSILVTLDCTLEVIDEAKEKGCELILSHHPLLFRKPASITEDTLLGRKIRKAISSNINIYAAHTNLDMAAGGINDLVLKLLGFKGAEVMEQSSNKNAAERDGIGRLVTLNDSISLSDLCNKVKEALQLNCVRFCGEDRWKVKKIAVINGSGQDYFGLAKKLGADCIISGDTSYHYVSDFYEEGIAVIDAGHFGTEWPAMKLFAHKLNELLREQGEEVKILVSEKNFDPYKIV
jgi:conserved hypothetical protein TIGR00486